MSSSSSRTIILKSSDGQTFKIEEAVAQQSVIIKHIIESDNPKTTIPFPNINGPTLSKIIDYCQKHVTDKDNEESLKSFDVDFVSNIDEVMLTYVSNAARFLDIKSLYNLCSTSLRNRLKAKSAEEICQMFSIQGDLTPVMEAWLRAKKT